jgi:UDP-2-acetamido-3-amino-2,3-dideoxy-glucuronate N-acetyltransferase
MIQSEDTAVFKRNFFAHPLALVDTDEVGQDTRIWAFAHVMRGAHVGSDCNLGEHTFIEGGASLGNKVTVKNGVSVWGRVTVEDNCFLGPHCVFTNDMNPRSYLKKSPEDLLPTLVRHHASIGANATIVCGHTIGAYAFVGAGSVVIRDVLEYGLVVGNPARQIGWICVCAVKLSIKAGAALGERAKCGNCGAEFLRTSAGLTQQN